MTPSARLAAAAEILDGFDWNAPADPQLRAWARANRYAGSKDRRAINDRVYGCLRRARSLAAGTGGEGRAIILKSLRDLDGLSPGGIEALCAGLGHGLAPLTDAEAAMLSLEPVWESEAERLDWPEWLWAEAQRSLGEDAADELEALRRRAPVDLRVNTLLTGRDAAQGVLAEEGVETESLALGETTLRAAPSAPVARSRAYLEGLVELQDAASQAVAEFAGAAPGMTVLDFCAGGGGKTLALAAAMEGEGRLVAHDVEARRMRDLPDRAARAGAGFIEIMAGASAMQSLEGACDIVVVDAP